MEKPIARSLKVLASHVALSAYAVLALFPVLLIILNSFKDRLTIFAAPFALPSAATFTLDGYNTLWTTARFDLFFLNSFLVTGGSLTLILLVSSTAAFALVIDPGLYRAGHSSSGFRADNLHETVAQGSDGCRPY
jgi:raffinose/stachyose/melibiose transport system permease protein